VRCDKPGRREAVSESFTGSLYQLGVDNCSFSGPAGSSLSTAPVSS
jgi:hypothetical protein